MDIAQFSIIPEETIDAMIDVLVDETGHLTQGCISTPYIANIYMTRFDYELTNYCERFGLTYTRYADDLQISSPEPIKKQALTIFIKELLQKYYKCITLNEEKTQTRSYRGHNYLLGICYNAEQNLTVGHDKKHIMKVIAHKVEVGDTEGIDIPHWKGVLSYYTMIEPQYFRQSRFNALRRA